MNTYPSYSVSIRTLGTAGEKYQETLNSVARQTVKPEKVLVYIPHGYQLPKETIGIEDYVRCDKGMVTQRSLPFDEITSEFILFLDDDLSFEADFVQKLFDGLLSMDGDCISPDIYRVQEGSLWYKLKIFWGGTQPHFDRNWAFKIRTNAHYSYNPKPHKFVLLSQAAAGACALCKKSAYTAIHFEDERWMDHLGYAYGEDEIFFYKMYLYGFKVMISYNARITHLDASAGRKIDETTLTYTMSLCRYLLWHRLIYSTRKTKISRFWCKSCYSIQNIFHLPLSYILAINHGGIKTFIARQKGRIHAKNYVKSEEYKQIPHLLKYRKDDTRNRS